jgi:hypothetical protein
MLEPASPRHPVEEAEQDPVELLGLLHVGEMRGGAEDGQLGRRQRRSLKGAVNQRWSVGSMIGSSPLASTVRIRSSQTGRASFG